MVAFLHLKAKGLKMVEVPGFEPGSMNPDQGVSTCLAYLLSWHESSDKRDLPRAISLILLLTGDITIRVLVV